MPDGYAHVCQEPQGRRGLPALPKPDAITREDVAAVAVEALASKEAIQGLGVSQTWNECVPLFFFLKADKLKMYVDRVFLPAFISTHCVSLLPCSVDVCLFHFSFQLVVIRRQSVVASSKDPGCNFP